MKRSALALALVAVLLSGCIVYEGWADVPASSVRPVVEVGDVSDRAWRDAVQAAADDWSMELAASGCPAPFVVAIDGLHPVRLVALEDWRWSPAWTGAMTPDVDPGPPGGIDIREDDGNPEERPIERYRSALLHELGHAIGLNHGDSPIMRTNGGLKFSSRLGADDVSAAADMMGCN